MSSFSPDHLIEALQFALGHVGVDPEVVTWSFISGVAATLASSFLFFRLAYHQPGKRVPPPKTDQGALESKLTPSRAMQRIRDAKRPEDGTVRVAEILVHPIKSCKGSSLQSCRYNLLGLEGDRGWCFVDATKNLVITAREFPRTVLITPRIEEDTNDPNGGSIVVTFPPDSPDGCTEFRVPLHPSPEVLKDWEIMPKLGLFSEFLDGYIGHSLPLSQPSVASSISSLFFNKPVHLVYKGPSPRLAEKTLTFPELSVTTMFQDGYPLLMLSKESMEEIEGEIRERVGTMGVGEVWKDGKVDIRRFRPNIIIEGGGPFAEDAWEEVTIGSKDAPAINLVSYCPRCLLPNVSPQTGERDKAVPYKVLSKFRAGMDPAQKLIPCVGCNGVFTGCGTVNVGDIVYVKKMLTSTPPNPV